MDGAAVDRRRWRTRASVTPRRRVRRERQRTRRLAAPGGGRGDRRSRSGRRRDMSWSKTGQAWRRDDAVERRRCRARTASPRGRRRFSDDRPISGSAAAPRPCAWAIRLFAAGDIDQDDGVDGGRAPAVDAEATWPVRATAGTATGAAGGWPRRIEVTALDEGRRGDRRSRSRLQRGILSCTTRVTGAPPSTCPGRRSTGHGDGTMRSSGGEAARGPRVRADGGGLRTIARSPEVLLPESLRVGELAVRRWRHRSGRRRRWRMRASATPRRRGLRERQRAWS